MDSDKYEFVQGYLQKIQETHSTTTETTDSGIRTPDYFESFDLEMQDISGKYHLLPPQGFGPEAKTRGGIIVSPAYTYKECVKYWCSMRINPDLMKLGAHGGLG